MIRLAAFTAALAGLLQCAGDETLSGYGATEAAWKLEKIDGTAFTANAILRFPEEGRIEGDAPCNSFSGTQTAPYPWFSVDQLASTKRACLELEAEGQFFNALGEMTLAEIADQTLILSNDAGREMLFRAVK